MSGVMLAFVGGGSGAVLPGQQLYTGAGTSYSWVAPSGVTSVSVVAVGNGCTSGGALSYKNNISVTPGSSYNVAIQTGTCNTNASYFLSTATVRAGNGSSRLGDGGGNGGTGGCGAGGAGGYSGNGGNGNICGSSPTNGSGGGGGGGGLGSGGGGVGVLGQGANGAASGGGGSGGGNAVGTSGGLYGGGKLLGAVTSGAVRIIWPGATRSFPSTCTGNL